MQELILKRKIILDFEQAGKKERYLKFCIQKENMITKIIRMNKIVLFELIIEFEILVVVCAKAHGNYATSVNATRLKKGTA